MDTILQDLRYALRALVKSPGFAVTATLTLGLAIGVNTSIFSLVSVIVFADLPMRDEASVAIVRGVNPALDIEQGSLSRGDYLDVVERARSFESLSALTSAELVLTGLERPERVEGLAVTPGLTETWRLPPVLGRGFAAGEDAEGAPPVVMLTHGFWMDRFGGRRDVLGETLRLDGVQRTVVGVMDPGFEFAGFSRVRVVVPLVIDRAAPDRIARRLFVAGRIAPGASQEAATEEVRRIGESLAREHPEENGGWGLSSAPVMDSLIDRNGNTVLLLLQLSVAMVILLACANIANMLLARATARERELAVRAALGAPRGRVLRQLMTESLVLSVVAAALGIGFAHALNEAMVRISAGTEDVFLMAALDGRVLAFTLTVALMAPLVFGLVPALHASRPGSAAALRDGRSGDGGRSGKRTRSVLVAVQVSLALTLMVVAGLLTRTVISLGTRPLGFDDTGLVAVEVELPETVYPEPEARRSFYEQARLAVGAVPGVDGVELLNAIPGVDVSARRSLVIEGREKVEGAALPAVAVVTVSPGLFDLVGLELIRGRAFVEADDASSFRAALLSRHVAERYWPGEDPVGRRFRLAGGEETLQVVGVVADVRSTTPTQPKAPNVYVPHAQDTRAAMYLVARAGLEPGALAGPIREAVWSVDAGQPIGRVRTFRQARYEGEATTYALIALFVTFAGFALLMAGVGIYGVMSYSVAQRRSEIGLRMALGAGRGDVRWMVVRQGAVPLAAGAGVGLLAAFAVSRLLSSLVVGISATDPLTFVGVPVVLGAVALAASLVPALRATRMDPARTLRAE